MTSGVSSIIRSISSIAISSSSSISTGNDIGNPMPGQCMSTSSSSNILTLFTFDKSILIPVSLSGGFLTQEVVFILLSSQWPSAFDMPFCLSVSSQNHMACLHTCRYSSSPSFKAGITQSPCHTWFIPKSRVLPCLLMNTVLNITSYLSMFTTSK
jgi:hypothetical protein